MLRTIAFYTKFAISLVTTMPLTKRLEKKVEEFDANNQIIEKYKYMHVESSKWAEPFIKLSGAKVTVFGAENLPPDIPVLFVSNHQSNFDIPLLMYYIDKPKGFIAKKELKKVPMINRWMTMMGCIFMDRSNLRKSAAAIIAGIKMLKSGQSLVICPEGTRSKGGPMANFKAGSFKLATKSKVPIVPITLNGSYKIMDGVDNKGKIKPAQVELYIHKPIYTKDLTKEEELALPKLVQDIVASKLSE
ncbi:1-acyl-sn-glycerol-3-phosphate acyltransferase [uncultured Clostridium sp.]|jgi:1-acyl-sn-glycerol-3-phosphate acyltransferase|uniref:lysophospholipid acyltransferase family protein n=1 Tax=uncultured Clostridium sp. TaxID=59620 RepID=UPI0026124C0D|nr:lysophospholipid acyltransferase family protein [uncultured Clostridium sp.]